MWTHITSGGEAQVASCGGDMGIGKRVHKWYGSGEGDAHTTAEEVVGGGGGVAQTLRWAPLYSDTGGH